MKELNTAVFRDAIYRIHKLSEKCEEYPHLQEALCKTFWRADSFEFGYAALVVRGPNYEDKGGIEVPPAVFGRRLQGDLLVKFGEFIPDRIVKEIELILEPAVFEAQYKGYLV